MNAESRQNGRCETCLSKNVQVVLKAEPLGQNGSKLFLRIASRHNSHSICAFLSKWCQKCPSGLSNCPSGCPQKCPSGCPSGLLDLEGYVMETGVELLWLPAARLAQIYGKSVKTIRRMIDDGTFIAVRRTVKSGDYRTTKLFVLVDQNIVDLDKQLCRKLHQEPVTLKKERMLIAEHEHSSLFIVSYNIVMNIAAIIYLVGGNFLVISGMSYYQGVFYIWVSTHVKANKAIFTTLLRISARTVQPHT